MSYRILQGDVLEVTRGYPDNHFDGLFCDPPYGLSFMGKGWDTFNPAKLTIALEKSRKSYERNKYQKQNNPNLKGRKSAPITGNVGDAGTYDQSRQGHLNFQEFMYQWAKETLRVLKPGAFGLVFGGTRTWHRLACALEDAGFEIRDTLMWIYGSGFPKSYDISKGIDKATGVEREVVGKQRLTGNALVSTKDKGGTYGVGVGVAPPGDIPITAPATPEAKRWQGYGTALKPSWEPVLLIRKPLDGNNVQNALKHGCGGLNIDGCRLVTKEDLGRLNKDDKGMFKIGKGANSQYGEPIDSQGRWPANLILSHKEGCKCIGTRRVKTGTTYEQPKGQTEGRGIFGPPSLGRVVGYADADGKEEIEVWECEPDCPIAMLDAQSGDVGGRWGKPSPIGFGKPRNVKNVPPIQNEQSHRTNLSYMRDTKGGASRFFYCAKASSAERNAGLEGFEEKEGGTNVKGYKGDGIHDITPRKVRTRNLHPTIKPLDLCRYLAMLILPPECEGNPRKLLVPFAGSGSEIIGGLQAGWNEVTGIEIDPEYCKIAKARLKFWTRQLKLKL